MTHSQRIAARIVLAWVQMYTRHLPPELRVTRRAEVESDLWEHVADQDGAGARSLATALEILLRTCRGVFDDVTWSFEAGLLAPDEPRRGGISAMDFKARRVRWVSIFMIAAAAIGALIFVLIPTLRAYFTAVGIPLPAPTRFVLSMSAFLTAYWWVSVAVGTALFLGVTRLSRVGALPDGQVDEARAAALTRAEPIVILGLAIVVGGLIVAMFLPFFDVVSAMN